MQSTFKDISQLSAAIEIEKEKTLDRFVGFLALIVNFQFPLYVIRDLEIGHTLTSLSPLTTIFGIAAISGIFLYIFRRKISLRGKAGILTFFMLILTAVGYFSYSFTATTETSALFAIAVGYFVLGKRAGHVILLIVIIVTFSAHYSFSVLNWRPDYDANIALRSFSGGFGYLTAVPIVGFFVYQLMMKTYQDQLELAYARLYASQERYQRSMMATEDIVWEWFAAEDHITWDDSAAELLGYEGTEFPFRELAVTKFIELIHPSDKKTVMQIFSSDNHFQDEAIDLELRIIGQDEEYRWFKIRGKFDFNDELQVTGAIGSIRNIQSRKQIEQRIERQEVEYRNFIESSNEAIWRVDFHTRLDPNDKKIIKKLGRGLVSMANQATDRLFSIGHLDKHHLYSLNDLFTNNADQDDLNRLLQLFIDSGCHQAVFESTKVDRLKNEQYLHHSLLGQHSDGKLTHIWGITSDISDLRQTQAKLNHAQKLDAIGQLAGGIAHDFNNSLGGILGATELMIRKNKQTDLDEYLKIVLNATERARDLNSKLLSFARKSKMTSTPVSVPALMQDAIALLKHSIGTHINVVTNLADEDIFVIGDPSEIHSAIINLGINSKDAMPDGGTIILNCEKVYLNQSDCLLIDAKLEPNYYVKITVSDTGMGIPKAIQDKIYDPFFTTKADGEGTGLGLAAIYGTVQNHKGAILMESTEGMGTTFSIYLPSVPIASAGSKKEMALDPIESKDKTILIIDDEEMIRILASELLAELGYKCILASGGTEGLKLLKEHQDEVDCVLLDFTMPEITGEKVFFIIHELYPELKVIMGSGFIGQETMERLQASGLKYFLDKPYNMSQLKSMLERVLR